MGLQIQILFTTENCIHIHVELTCACAVGTMPPNLFTVITLLHVLRHAVVQLVEALCYKQGSHWFNFR